MLLNSPMIQMARYGLRRFVRDEQGASAVEYALIAGLIAVGLVTAVGFLTTGISTAFQNIADQLTGDAG